MINFLDIFEAISVADAKKMGLSRAKSGAYRNKKLEAAFQGKDRLVFPFGDVPLKGKIKAALADEGFVIGDFKKGVAYEQSDKEQKQPRKIGKLLRKLGHEDLMDQFKKDTDRDDNDEAEYSIVISRHPYDVAGMSTDRNWTSCMNLGLDSIVRSSNDKGINARYVKSDIQHGSFVAYLVSNDDVHPNGKLALRKPLARILMKPHKNESGDTVWSQGKLYGTYTPGFSYFMKDWLLKNTNKGASGTYALQSGLYPDGDMAIGFSKSNAYTDEARTFFEAISYENEKYLDKFETNFDFGYDDGRSCEVKVTFEFDPNEIKIESVRYDNNQPKPKYVEKLFDALTAMNTIMTVELFEETNSVVIEHWMPAHAPDYGYYGDEEDEDYEPEIDWSEEWEHYFEAYNVDDYSYVEERKILIEFLKDGPAQHEDEYVKAWDTLRDSVKDNPALERPWAEIQQLYGPAKEAQEVVKKLWEIDDPEQLEAATKTEEVAQAHKALTAFFSKYRTFRQDILPVVAKASEIIPYAEKTNFFAQVAHVHHIRSTFEFLAYIKNHTYTRMKEVERKYDLETASKWLKASDEVLPVAPMYIP